MFTHIYKVECPCEIRDVEGNMLYYREKKKPS